MPGFPFFEFGNACARGEILSYRLSTSVNE